MEGGELGRVELDYRTVVCVVEKNAVAGDFFLMFVDTEEVRMEPDPTAFYVLTGMDVEGLIDGKGKQAVFCKWIFRCVGF